MVLLTACLLAAIASGVTGALSVASCNLFHFCEPRRPIRDRDDEDAMDEPAVQNDVPVEAEPQQYLALSATSNGEDKISIRDNNELNVGSSLVRLQLQHGLQVLRVDSLASGVRLYNWASIRCPLPQRAILLPAVEQVLERPGGSDSAVQLPAATTTALIPWSPGPVRAFRRSVVIGPGLTPASTDIATTVMRTISVFTPHLRGVGPANADHNETEMTANLGWWVVAVLPQQQQQRQPYQDPPVLNNYCAASKTLVRFDESYGTAKAPTALFSNSTVYFEGVSPFMLQLGLAQQCFLKDRTSGVGGTCSFILDSSTCAEAWSWSSEVGIAAKQQQFKERGGPVDDELGSMMDVKDQEDPAPKLELKSVDVSTTPPLTPASATSSPTVADAADSDNKNGAFFAASYYDGDGSSSSTGASSSEEETTMEEVGDTVDKFDPIVKGHKAGQLRKLHIKNLRQSKVGGFGDICTAVRIAQAGLGGSGKDAGVLEEGEVLGEGSFGIVNVGRHSVLAGDFAVKMLKEGAREEARICATTEMIALARLATAPHENVLGASAIDDRIGRKMRILFPMAQVDFAAALVNGCLGMSTKLRCLQQVASGLSHMHGLGIGHGDVKAANILLFDDGQGGCVPKVCDFGMARAMGEERPEMMGTPGFMPLEVMRRSVITHPSQDVFAMGVLAFLVCMSPDKARPNMFVSPELYTDKEADAKKALEAELDYGCPLLAARRQRFELTVTQRTMADGSFEKLMAADHLHPELGSSEVKNMVKHCFLPFMDKEPTLRPGMAYFEDVMGNFATVVEEATSEEEVAGGERGEEYGDIGLDLDGDEEDYENNELFF